MHFVVTLFYVLPLLLHPRLSHRTLPPSSPLAAPPLRHSPLVCLFLSLASSLFVVSRPFSSSICASSYSRRYPLVASTYSRVFASIRRSPVLASVSLWRLHSRTSLTYMAHTILPRWSFRVNQIFAGPATFPPASQSRDLPYAAKSTSKFRLFPSPPIRLSRTRSSLSLSVSSIEFSASAAR